MTTVPTAVRNLPPELIGQMARGGLIGLGGSTLGRAAKFLLNLVLANALGAAAYGLYSIGFNTIVTLQPLLGLGQRVAMVKYVAEYQACESRERLKASLWWSLKTIVISGAVMTVALYCLADRVALRIFRAASLGPVLKLFALGLLPLLLLSLGAGVIQGMTRIGRSVVAEEVLFPAVNLLLAVLFLLLGWKLSGAVLALVVAAAAAAAVGWRWIFGAVRHLPPGCVPESGPPRHLLRFSLQAMLITLASTVFNGLDVLILGRFQPPGQVGLYNAAARVATQFSLLHVGLVSIYSPLVSAIFARNKPRELEALFQVATEWLLATGLPLVITLAALAR